jgi:hypothetical protein
VVDDKKIERLHCRHSRNQFLPLPRTDERGREAKREEREGGGKREKERGIYIGVIVIVTPVINLHHVVFAHFAFGRFPVLPGVSSLFLKSAQ